MALQQWRGITAHSNDWYRPTGPLNKKGWGLLFQKIQISLINAVASVLLWGLINQQQLHSRVPKSLLSGRPKPCMRLLLMSRYSPFPIKTESSLQEQQCPTFAGKRCIVLLVASQVFISVTVKTKSSQVTFVLENQSHMIQTLKTIANKMTAFHQIWKETSPTALQEKQVDHSVPSHAKQ